MPRSPLLAPLVAALILAPQLASVGTAEAAFIRRTAIKQVTNANGSNHRYRIVVVVDGSAPAAAVNARVESDAGGEDVKLGNAGARLHGAATIAKLPAVGASITLTLHDGAAASLASYAGKLGANGAVVLTAASSATAAPDIQLVAADVFPAATGYDLAFDLTGAALFEMSYAKVSVVESDEVTTCTKNGACTKTGGTTTTAAEVVWDDIGVAWEGELKLEHDGVVETKVTARDARGKKLETATSMLGAAWLDRGEGINALAVDGAKRTTVAVIGWSNHSFGQALDLNWGKLVVVSEGWAAADALPTHAEVELTDGETTTLPANSYQRRQRTAVRFLDSVSEPLVATYRIVVNNGDAGSVTLEKLSLADLRSPVCSEGFCVVLSPGEDGGHDLGLSTYGANPTDLPNKVELVHTLFDKQGKELTSESAVVTFDDEIAVVFAGEVRFSEDPIGLDQTGKVRLLGAANKKDKQSTLRKGSFAGIFSRDGDGDLELAGADKDKVSARRRGRTMMTLDHMLASPKQAPPVVVFYSARRKFQIAVQKALHAF